MKKIVSIPLAILLPVLIGGCGKPVDPRESFNLERAEMKWNSTTRQWIEAELRQLEYGESLYNSFCAACHLSSGEGQSVMGAPALKDNGFVRGPVKAVAGKVLFSTGSTMPRFDRSLDDRQVAAILSYIRNAWGKQLGEVVKADVVARARQVKKAP